MSAPMAATIAILERLVGFDTTSAKTNMLLVDFVCDYLRGHGLSPILVPDATGEKAALHVTIGPQVAGGIVLSAHTDVVPVTGQPWTSDPFVLTRRGDRLYGRGSTDMKGFVATVLALVPEWTSARLARPIHIALSYDEEIGCVGVRPLAADMHRRIARPAAVIVGEPTSLRPVDAHKSGYRIETRITGREAHSSVPAWGVNAIAFGARIVAEIDRLGERLARLPAMDKRFEPPYPTVNVGKIRGGTAHNIVARDCSVVWGIRGMPETDVEVLIGEIDAFAKAELLPAMRLRAPEASIETAVMSSILPLRSHPGSPAETLIARLTGISHMQAVSYGTDGGFFDAIGWPTVVCGPGDIAQAHRPDEFIEEAALADCAALLRRLPSELA